MTDAIPAPGSAAAIAQGCLCPRMDNHHGAGFEYGGRPCYWIRADCPLHGGNSPETPDSSEEGA